MQWIQVVLAAIKLLNASFPLPVNWEDRTEVLLWLTSLNEPAATVIVEMAELITDGKVGDGSDTELAELVDKLAQQIE